MLRKHTTFLALSAILPLALLACGGPGPEASGSPESAASSDERYVADVCTAAGTMFAAYQKSFSDNLGSLGGMDPTDAYIRTARQPFARLVDDLGSITPPTAWARTHQDAVEQAKEVLDALNRADRQKLLVLRGTPDTGTWKQVVDLPGELKSQFGATSLHVRPCQELASLGGGNPFR
jgi:hypothetical protein